MQNLPHWSRREFLRNLAALGAASWALPNMTGCVFDGSDRLGPILPLRTLGNTGVNVTMLGLGGYHVGSHKDSGAQAMIETALESGVRFFDTAESYQSGESEKKYGKFLVPRYREHSFIMTKSTAKDAETARKHLDGSLKRLGTDYIDLWLVHAVASPEDVASRRDNGVLDVFYEAKASGKVKFIGVSGHTRTSAILEILRLSDRMEACLMPINAVDPGYDSFITKVLPELTKRGVGVLAMKTLSNGGFFGKNLWARRPTGKGALVPNRISVEEAISFAWSLPVANLVTGPDNLEQLREKVRIARSFRKLDEKQRQAIIDKVADLAGNAVEYYKA